MSIKWQNYSSSFVLLIVYYVLLLLHLHLRVEGVLL
jgi:hypothetical protein